VESVALPIAMVWQILITGITVGCVYALMSLGLTMVYGILGILHIAHAGVFVLGAYLGLAAYGATHNFLWALLTAMAGCAACGWLIERWLYRPILHHPPIVPLIASIGLFIFLGDLYRLVAGPYVRAFPARIPLPSLSLGGVVITNFQVLIAVTTVILLIALWAVVGRTRLGLAWRALAQDREIAMAMGVNVHQAVAANIMAGSALAGAAGVLVGVYYNNVAPTMGDVPAYKTLAVIVLGGLGNIPGTIVAGLLLGLVETAIEGTVGFVLPRDAIAFLALILMLLVRPSGVLGRR